MIVVGVMVIGLQFCVGDAVGSGRAVRVNFNERNFFVPLEETEEKMSGTVEC